MYLPNRCLGRVWMAWGVARHCAPKVEAASCCFKRPSSASEPPQKGGVPVHDPQNPPFHPLVFNCLSMNVLRRRRPICPIPARCAATTSQSSFSFVFNLLKMKEPHTKPPLLVNLKSTKFQLNGNQPRTKNQEPETNNQKPRTTLHSPPKPPRKPQQGCYPHETANVPVSEEMSGSLDFGKGLVGKAQGKARPASGKASAPSRKKT